MMPSGIDDLGSLDHSCNNMNTCIGIGAITGQW